MVGGGARNSGIVRGGGGIFQTLLPVLFVRTLHLPEAVTGLFLAAGGVGVFTGSLLARPLASLTSVRAALWAGAVGLMVVWVPIYCSPLRTARDLPGV
ncbi:hypothetical protein [Kitasatospora sp. NPDC093558]|uniref:hypothetical protein n=1 Tax=Kitasatospora sp. NPDC093558 TaxID=3155201 RepID=UPI00342A8523